VEKRDANLLLTILALALGVAFIVAPRTAGQSQRGQCEQNCTRTYQDCRRAANANQAACQEAQRACRERCKDGNTNGNPDRHTDGDTNGYCNSNRNSDGYCNADTGWI